MSGEPLFEALSVRAARPLPRTDEHADRLAARARQPLHSSGRRAALLPALSEAAPRPARGPARLMRSCRSCAGPAHLGAGRRWSTAAGGRTHRYFVVIALIILGVTALVSFLRNSGESVPAADRTHGGDHRELASAPARVAAGARPGGRGGAAHGARTTGCARTRACSRSRAPASAEARAHPHRPRDRALLSLESTVPKPGRGPLAVAFSARAMLLSLAFRRVVLAQIWDLAP